MGKKSSGPGWFRRRPKIWREGFEFTAECDERERESVWRICSGGVDWASRVSDRLETQGLVNTGNS